MLVVISAALIFFSQAGLGALFGFAIEPDDTICAVFVVCEDIGVNCILTGEDIVTYI